jgi:hypothetical protein
MDKLFTSCYSLLINFAERSSAISNDTSTKKEVNGFCAAIQVLFHKTQEICNSDQVISSAEQLETGAESMRPYGSTSGHNH